MSICRDNAEAEECGGTRNWWTERFEATNGWKKSAKLFLDDEEMVVFTNVLNINDKSVNV